MLEINNGLKLRIYKRLRAVVVLLCVACASHAQVALKTNLPLDALLMPNLAMEVGLGNKFTADLTGYYTPFKHSDTKQHKLLMIQPELRYWLCDTFNGHFFGLHLMGGAYNTWNVDMPFGVFDDVDKYRYKGRFYGAGISYGYQHILSEHWNIEGTIGLGYNYVTYKKYDCGDCGEQRDKGNKNYLGPTKLALNLVYLF